MKFKYLDKTGDTVQVVENIDLARELFSAALESGKLVAKTTVQGKHVQVRDFDELTPDDELLVIPVYVGG